ERYFVLALSQRRISLFRGNREGLTLMAAFDADYGEPRSKQEKAPEASSVEVPRGKNARDTRIHFRPLSRVSRFIELTEPHIWTLLHRETSPLILVGTPFMHRLYRNMNCYAYLSEEGV